jgi:hypothetical protein
VFFKSGFQFVGTEPKDKIYLPRFAIGAAADIPCLANRASRSRMVFSA